MGNVKNMTQPKIGMLLLAVSVEKMTKPTLTAFGDKW
jgi:hypothetical protein